MSNEQNQSDAKSHPVDTLVMCKFFNCKKPATAKIVRANGCFCGEHLAFNIAQFGCNFTIAPVNVQHTYRKESALDGYLTPHLRE